MTYEDLKNKYDELLSLGTNVLSLKGDDELTRSLRAIGRVKAILDDCERRGKPVYNLSKADPEYRKVKDIYMTINGSRVPLMVKFKLAGYYKKVVKAPSYEELKERLDRYVESGKPLGELRALDYELYTDIRNSRLMNFDARATLFEKIKVLGYEKPRIKAENAEEELQKQIATFLANGGDINIDTGDMPFKKLLWQVMKKYRRKGTPLSAEQILRKNGARQYSAAYTEFKRIFELSRFRDQDGYVDTYRKNARMNATIDDYGEKLNMPQSVIVLLIANENLRKSFLKTDAILYTQRDIEKYLKDNGSFKGIRYNNPQLLDRLHHMRRHYTNQRGEKLSTRQVIEILGFEDEDEVFKGHTDARELNVDEFVEQMLSIASKQGGKISRSDIDNKTYYELLSYVRCNGITINDFFNQYNIKYVDYKKYGSFEYVSVDSYPFIDEMRQERDQRMQKFYAKNPIMPKPLQFEEYLKICKEVYAKYNEKFMATLSSKDIDELDKK